MRVVIFSGVAFGLSLLLVALLVVPVVALTHGTGDASPAWPGSGQAASGMASDCAAERPAPLAVGIQTDQTGWFTFTLPWDDASPTMTDADAREFEKAEQSVMQGLQKGLSCGC
jgi:hypothetical protein